MTRLQKLQLRQSEVRERIATILDTALETRSDEQNTELETLTTEARSLERELRAALAIETPVTETVTTGSAEEREIQGLHKRASIIPFLEEVHRERECDGVERELRAALVGQEHAHGGLLPVEMLLPPGATLGALETRADAATTVDSAALADGSQASILERVFTRSIAARLGVAMPAVPVGAANFPVMLTGTAAAMKAPGASQDASAATFTGFTLDPKRLTARYVWRMEDAAKLRNYEAALRRDLTAVMSDAMDHQIVNGNGQDNNVTGFLAELPAATDDSDATTWSQYLSKFTSLVDGLNAYNLSDLRAVVGSETFSYAETLFRTGDTDNGPRASACEYVTGRIGGKTVSSRIPAADGSTNIQNALVALTSYPGRNAVAPIWKGINLIRDHYTGASAGEVALTAHVLWNFKLVRETGYKLISVKTA